MTPVDPGKKAMGPKTAESTRPMPINALVRLALDRGARLVGSSYNEPLITAEWAIDVFREARPAGLRTLSLLPPSRTRDRSSASQSWMSRNNFV